MVPLHLECFAQWHRDNKIPVTPSVWLAGLANNASFTGLQSNEARDSSVSHWCLLNKY